MSDFFVNRTKGETERLLSRVKFMTTTGKSFIVKVRYGPEALGGTGPDFARPRRLISPKTFVALFASSALVPARNSSPLCSAIPAKKYSTS